MTLIEGGPVRTREGDDPAIVERIRKARSEGRRRTIVLSVIASGIVSLFIGNFIERESDNSQADRSRVNCESINDDRRDTANELDSRADQVLGDPKEQPPISPFQFKGTAFAEFEPLIRAQALQNRERAQVYFDRIEDCDKTFPKRGYIPFVD